MSNEANPAPQDATPVPSPSLEDRLAAKLHMADDAPEKAPASEPAQAEPVEAEGIDLDAVEAEPADQPDGEWLELDRKGEKRKVSKEEAKRLAQQGWDYSQNMEQTKAEKAMLAQYRQSLESKAKITPEVIEARANVVAYERALAPYHGVDWNNLAQTDPISYTQHRAQFDSLRDAYQQANHQFQNTLGQAQKVEQAITESELAQERQRLYELAPDLRDEQRMSAEQGRMVKFLGEIGADEGSMRFVASSATAFAVVRDAMRYREAVKAKSERVKDTPTVRPGVSPPRATAGTEKAELTKQLHQAKDPTRKKALFDQVLDKKLARFF